jgi:hypothetical protein
MLNDDVIAAQDSTTAAAKTGTSQEFMPIPQQVLIQQLYWMLGSALLDQDVDQWISRYLMKSKSL